MFIREFLTVSAIFLFLTTQIYGQCTSKNVQDEEYIYGTFPSDFMWGLATSSHQIEGAWNIDGKGENIWDNFTHRSQSPIRDGSTADIACDSYNNYDIDALLLRNMGAHFYRFSIAWSRIFTDGTLATINPAGIDYYNRLIDTLLSRGVIPMVTLYHWDLPQPLQDIGGWPNEAVAEHFAEYARVCFASFGDRVKHWITFNEPFVFCQLGYAYGTHAPGISAPAVLPYQCAHTVIKSHGLAYRIYDAEFRATQNGQVGITLDAGWPEPIDDTNQADLEASEREMQFKYGWFAYPLTHGVYPPIMRQLIDAKSEAEGREESRLPSFDVGWTYIINGTLDFYGLNHYSSHYVFPSTGGSPGWDGDKDTAGCSDPSWPPSAASWLNVVPWGFRKILRWIGNEFGNKPIYVTENGFADRDVDGLNDVGRQNYYNLYINEMMKAVNVDGVNVKGYTAWSLIDNFEWAEGYTQRFGVHHIQFNDPRRTRWPKDSALLLTKIFRENGFPNPKANARNKY